MPTGDAFSLMSDLRITEKTYGRDAVIESVLGCFLDEDENLISMDVVNETYKNLSSVDLFSYAASITGPNDYRESVKKHVLGDHIEYFANSHIGVVATVGGSGAISNVIKGYTDPGQTILLPNYVWEPYKIFAQSNGLNCEFYTLFDGDQFFVNDLVGRIIKIAQQHHKVILMINDPCQNPTGYSLSFEEWEQVVQALKVAAQYGDVILLDDVAYLDYDFRGHSEARRHFRLLAHLPENILSVIAFSISKSLTCYGLRVGAEIAISSSKKVIDDFNRVSSVLGRSTWSTVPRGGMDLFVKLHEDENLFAKLKTERDRIIAILKERAKIFLEEAKNIGLYHLPFRGGFFLTVPMWPELTKAVVQDLKRKNVFVLPIEGGLRIALCSAPTRKLRLLAQHIRDSIEKCQSR
ncbi:MAG: aminotransferase class I/II-fold pyridoxal phosphate-dependent enzyme [Holosporaceae bacterium]|nr:aminotransferase class I/II-fold pyridoxal phosphate-dependent enzyme [Holosporaceae bacterium]